MALLILQLMSDELDFDFVEPAASKQQRVRATLNHSAAPTFVHSGGPSMVQRAREPCDSKTVSGMRGLLMLLEEERATLDEALTTLIKETVAAPIAAPVVAAPVSVAVAPAAVATVAVSGVTGGGMKRSPSATGLNRSNSACNLEVLAMLAMPDAAAAWRGGTGGVF